jgi:spore coat protein A, manganese oxidase
MPGLTTRRAFFRQTTIAMMAAVLPRALGSETRSKVPTLDPGTLVRFVDPLPLPSVARPEGDRPAPDRSGDRVPFYRVSMQAMATKLHRDLPPTNMWSYGGSVPGVMFSTQSGHGFFVDWENRLPSGHFLPIDYSIHGAAHGTPEVRSVVHMHGAKTLPESDGYPEEWFLPGETRTYYYPNDQDAALLWYHDHALGITRLNIYAGLLGLHIVRDSIEKQLQLPDGKYEIPLVLFDRHLDANGQLRYPVSSDPSHPWIAEVLGEVPLVNGKIFPYLEVEPRKYRFRILNAANGRLYRVSLSDDAEMHQIGTDQGLLPNPITVTQIQLAPGERVDLVIDFAPFRGTRIVLSDDAFPLMEFRVGASAVGDSSELPHALRSVTLIPESSAVKTRWLTLDELKKGMSATAGMLLNKTPWHMPITEKPRLGTIEIWELANLTDDIHPIHLHLVRFRILDRRRFDAFQYMTTGELRYREAPTPPDPSEAGWKDTVRVNAQTVTRIIIAFEGYPGRYVWHCHNLEHEDNEMMRPYEVVTTAN